MEQADQSAVTLARCHAAIAHLNGALGWGLPHATRQRYAERIFALCQDSAAMNDIRLETVIRNFHAEHDLIEALLERGHPDHEVHWKVWSEQALRVLYTRFRNVSAAHVASTGFDDLVQEALHDLWRALPTFRYESTFHTWALAVISNCYLRRHRTTHARKRGSAAEVISLEQLQTPSIGALDVPTAPAPDDTAFAALFAAHLQQVLTQHPDHRLRVVFHLWAHEDQPLRVIGNYLSLSIPRVHALLNQALSLLRAETTIRDWNRPT